MVDQEIKASVGKGIAVFVGINSSDTESTLCAAAEKILNIRIFQDQSGRLFKSVQDKKYSILCIPNFTLCATTTKGRRPSFEKAMAPVQAEKMFDKLMVLLQNSMVNAQPGCFGANMNINLELDGPVNIILKI